jgi:hypothetical protein
MNPLLLGLPLAIPSLSIASRAAGSGLGFLKSLVSSPTPSPALQASNPGEQLTELQRAVAEEVRRGGFGAALPLEVADLGQGGLRVLSGTPDRAVIEQRLNANPYLVQQFRTLTDRAGSLFRLTIPAGAGLDASA